MNLQLQCRNNTINYLEIDISYILLLSIERILNFECLAKA